MGCPLVSSARSCRLGRLSSLFTIVLYLWVADGKDGWDQSVWYAGVTGKEPNGEEESDPDVKASGVKMPESLLDEFVVMRMAEMLQEGKARKAVECAISKWSGNEGRLALSKCAKRLNAALAQLEDSLPDEI
jgi:hypothetical protein